MCGLSNNIPSAQAEQNTARGIHSHKTETRQNVDGMRDGNIKPCVTDLGNLRTHLHANTTAASQRSYAGALLLVAVYYN